MNLRWIYALIALLSVQAEVANADPVQAGGGDGAEPIQHCNTDLKFLNTVTGWQVRWPHDWVIAAASPHAMGADFYRRWALAPRLLAEDMAKLRLGMTTGTEAPRSTVLKVLSEVTALTSEMDHGQFATGEWKTDDHRRSMIEAIRPAVETYRRFLAEDYLPRASRNDGLPRTDEGRRCYHSAVAEWTGIAIETPEIEQIGWRLLRQTDADLIHTARINPQSERTVLDRLRTPDPNSPITGKELVEISIRAIRRAEAALPGWFADLPQQPLAVIPMDLLTAESAPGGVYHPAGEDQASAAFAVNTLRPTERRLMAEVIAFHEGVPGHHLAFVASRSASKFNAGFAEGWAIYAEYLADQMHLYSSPDGRLGMITKHLWAASRLVVEPGLHIHGWTRDKAIRFMLEHTALPRTEIENEVDRYISMPGQSLSYMLGYERFREARDRAQRALGSKFSYSKFHQVLLAKGMRNFDEVDHDIDAWVASEKRQSATH